MAIPQALEERIQTLFEVSKYMERLKEKVGYATPSGLQKGKVWSNDFLVSW